MSRKTKAKYSAAARKESRAGELRKKAAKTGNKRKKARLERRATKKEWKAKAKRTKAAVRDSGGSRRQARKSAKGVRKQAKADKYQRKLDSIKGCNSRKCRRRRKRWTRKRNKKQRKADRANKQAGIDHKKTTADHKKDVNQKVGQGRKDRWDKRDKAIGAENNTKVGYGHRFGKRDEKSGYDKYGNKKGFSYAAAGTTKGSGDGNNGVSSDQNAFTKPNPAAFKPIGNKFKALNIYSGLNTKDRNNPFTK